MNRKRLKNGFSLTEVLMASGILAVGLVMIAGTFPVAIFLTGESVEQTIAPIAVDEAVAKMRLFGLDYTKLPLVTDPVKCIDYNSVNPLVAAGMAINPDEYIYPSLSDTNECQYHWSAICRRLSDSNSLVQVTVFVSRRTGAWLKYPNPAGGADVSWPMPLPLDVTSAGGSHVTIAGNYITDGCTVVADASGNIYRVLDHLGADATLDRPWTDTTGPNTGWIIPPPIRGGRSPCVGVYQRIIRF
jgi:prepilin-type N-terminal cleavage/methylation domain-containing protein